METCKAIHITGPEDTTNDVLVSLTLPIQGTVHRFYMNCTWLGRALHTAWLPGRGFPFTLTPTHNFHHHILMLQQRFTNFLLKHGHTVIPLASFLLENLFSWFTGIWRNMWTWGKWSTSKVNVIPVAFTFPFSTLYVVTFSDLDYWDHNWGLFDNSVASRGSLISWNNITWSPTPIHHPRQSVMMMQLHIILPRNALFTLL